MMRPLAGIRVLDFSTLLPGPMATLLLAEAGAEVIKIERPGGEEMRHYPPRWGENSVNFSLLNRGKKSFVADLKDPQQRDHIVEMAKTCDVLVEQFRPGVMERLGLGYKGLRKINPKIVYCAITGYGQTGPRRDRAGHDLNYIGDAGLLALSVGAAGQRVVPPALIADIAGGAYPAVMNILLALRQREASGEGSYLDVSMAENMFTFMYWAIGKGLATDAWAGNSDALVTGGTARYHLYDTRDGKVVAAAPIEQKFWIAFAAAIELESELIDDKRDPKATLARVTEIIAGRTAAEWTTIFDAADCCCSIVQDAPAALDDPHFQARGIFARSLVNEDRAKIAALPVPISPAFRSAVDEQASAPLLGAHQSEFDA